MKYGYSGTNQVLSEPCGFDFQSCSVFLCIIFFFSTKAFDGRFGIA